MFLSAIYVCISILICTLILIYLINEINKFGFNCYVTFMLILLMFYNFIPLLFMIFVNKRDTTTAFNVLLSMKSNEEISASILSSSVLIAMIVIFYHVKISKGSLFINFNILKEQKMIGKSNLKINVKSVNKISKVADITFLIGVFSIVICIISANGVLNYLALGSQARGINKDISAYINPSVLPLITLSNITLVSPFLYKFVVQTRMKSVSAKIKYCISFFIATFYLIYNQGRLPLLLFFVPFILDLEVARKSKISSIMIVSIICILALEPLSNLFTYIAFGRIQRSQSNRFIETLLLEFTYPFANFLNKRDLMESFGMRYGIDYLQWPLTIFPSSILKKIGFSKSNIVTIGSLNTEAYTYLTGIIGGGIPTDFFTFNYYQFGILSLLISLFLVAIILKNIDKRIYLLTNIRESRILTLRLCFLLVSMVNNFDFSVIFRMRFDFFIILWAIFNISKNVEVTNEH